MSAASDSPKTRTDTTAEMVERSLMALRSELPAAIVDDHASHVRAEINRLRAWIKLMDPVVSAACRVVAADLYTHPILSRAEAVAAGVAELQDAVGKYQSARPASGARRG